MQRIPVWGLALLTAFSPAAALANPAINAGDLVIREFRLRGTAGANDEYVEIYNTTNTSITVQSSDQSSGFGLFASDGLLRFAIPNGTVIPSHGHVLGMNVMCSLVSSINHDYSWTTDIPDNAGIALFSSSDPLIIGMGDRLDAVGSTSEANALYKTGIGYSALTPFSINYAFYRGYVAAGGSTSDVAIPGGTDGVPINSGNNASDFIFVDTNGTSAGAGQRLGAPGPSNSFNPISSWPASPNLAYANMDPTAQSTYNDVNDLTSDPAHNATFGTYDFYRTFTNNTGAPLTALRFRIVKLTTFPAPSGFADLRPRTSSGTSVTVGTTTYTVHGTTLDMTSIQYNGGGWNSTMSVPDVSTGSPLANGASITVHFVCGVQQTGTYGMAMVAEGSPAVSQFFYITNATPTITSSLTASGTYGTAITNYTITASTAVTGYSATNLPPGLTINTTTGVISGTPTDATASPYSSTITATTTNGPATATLVFTINKVPVTITGITADKTFDGNNTATLSLTNAQVVGAVNNDTLSPSSTSTSADYTNGPAAGVNKAVETSAVFSVTGANAGDYTVTQPTLTGTISRLALTVSGLTITDKTYDGTVNVAVNGANQALQGVISTANQVSLTGTAAGTTVGSDVGANLPVTVTGLSLQGASSSNYTLTLPTNLKENISTAPVTITGVTVIPKIYDGTAGAILNTSNAQINGIQGEENIALVTSGATGTFGDPNVGTKTVTTAGFTLSGATAQDYALTQPTISGSIQQASATVTLGNLAATYNGSPVAVTVMTNPANLPTTISYGSSNTAPTNGGTYNVTAVVTNPNYSGSQSGSLVISAASQTITFPSVNVSQAGQTVMLSATASSGLSVTYAVVSGNAQLQGASLTLFDSKPVVVTASQAGNGNYYATSASQTITASNKQSQTITFNALPNLAAGSTATVALTATASSGLPVSFTVISGPATITSGSTTLQLSTSLLGGAITVQASQAGNDTYAAATPVNQSFTVTSTGSAVFFGGFNTMTATSTGAKAPAAANRQAYAATNSGVGAYLQSNGAGTLIGALPDGSGFVASFQLKSDNTFSVSTPDLTGSASAGATLNISGAVSGTTLTGSIAGLNLTFTLNVDPTSGSSAASVGLYQSAALNASSGAVYTLVGTQNDVFVLALTPNAVSAGTGTLSGNAFNLQLSGAVAVSGSINPATTQITGTLTTASGTSTYSGLPSSTARTDRLVNLSTLGSVSGNNALVAGFVIGGTNPKPMVLRGIGPGLTGFGVSGVVTAPVLTLFDGTGKVLQTNSAWNSSATSGLAALFASLSAFPLTAGSNDTAISTTLQPGAYTLQVSTAGAAGKALIELYDAADSGQMQYQRLLNISSRGLVAGATTTLSGGFIITGNDSKQVLVRGIGPGLAQFGVTGVLSAPTLVVTDTHGNVLAANQTWGTPVPVVVGQAVASAATLALAMSEVGAFSLPSGSADSALIVTLPPGSYTALVAGVNGASGTALVEIYEIPAQ